VVSCKNDQVADATLNENQFHKCDPVIDCVNHSGHPGFDFIVGVVHASCSGELLPVSIVYI